MTEYNYGIDSHKLIYHVDRVNDWLKGKIIYPIYIEAAPSGGCNQRCIFCGLDYTGHKAKFISISCWKNFISEAAKLGLKSVLLSGEGEPLLNKDICEFVTTAKSNGVDTAIASNAVFLTKDIAKNCLPHLTWLRVSLDAASPDVYALIHGVDKKQFDTVVDNVRETVRIKKQQAYPVTIGIQFLLLKENYKDIEKAVILSKKIGVDYFSVKPYSKHPLSLNNAGTALDYLKWMSLEDKLSRHNSANFKVIFRKAAMRRKAVKKPYSRCLGLPFWAYINSLGDVYSCSTFLGLKKYCSGNIYKQKFSQIWQSEKRRLIMKRIEKMDARECRQLCRLDEINTYLWNLKNPGAHVNFI